MRARYYNPEIKRFVNQDVLIGTISDSPTMNRYAYVNGNPISLSDPFGLSPMINWSSAGHTALSFLGLLTLIPTPVTIAIGVAANVINAIWYFAEGNTFQGVCSLLCALPGIGNAIGKIGAVGSKVASISGSIAKSLHIIGNGGFVATGFHSIGEMGYNNWQRYVVGNETYTLEQAGADLLTGALSILSIYGGGKGLGWDQVEVPTKLKGCVNIGGSSKGGNLTIIEGGNYSKSELRAAQYMANEGNNVVLRPPVGRRVEGGTSDLLVNDIPYDVYSPQTKNPNAIIRAISKKNDQATGIVVDLANTSVSESELGNVLARVRGAIESNGGTCRINDIVVMPK